MRPLPKLLEVPKPAMAQRIEGGDAHLGPQLQAASEHVQAAGVNLRQDQAEILRRIHMPSRLVLGKRGDAGPAALARGTHQAEDFLELVFVCCAREERAAGIHFSHDTAGGPDVDRGVVRAAAEKDIRGAIPEGHYFVTKRVDGDAEGSSKTEIGQFELAFAVDEEILGFQVAVQDAILVAEGDTLEQLVHERFDGNEVELTALATAVHIFLKVFVHVLEHKHQFILGMNNIV